MQPHPTYEVLDEIGRGARATVWRARDLALKRYVAIKELHDKFKADPHRMEQFWEEAAFLANLRHENIVQLHALDKERGWIVMELMQGSLEDKRKEGALPADVVRSVLRQALAGLAALHESGKFHGDIRPSNLLIDARGRVKLSDSAGMALGGEIRRPSGSAKYLAPEMLNPEFGPVGKQADLYCLGFTALELLKGPGFDKWFKGVAGAADPEIAWLRCHTSTTEVLPPVEQLVPGAPADLARVLDRLLPKPVAERYASAADALKDLENKPIVLVALAGTAAPAKPAPPVAAGPGGPAVQYVGAAPPAPRQPAAPARAAPAAKPKRSRTNTLILSGILAVLVVAVAVIAFWPESPAAPTTVDVVLQTTPAGATVRINDAVQPKKTPGPFALQMGDNRIKIEMEGHEDRSIKVFILKDGRLGLYDPPESKPPKEMPWADGKAKDPIVLTLKPVGGTPPAPATARLTVQTDPPGAAVYLDGVKQAQLSGVEYTLKVAAKGETAVQVKVELAGYDTLEKTVKLTAGAVEKVNYPLTKTTVPTPTAKLTVATDPPGATVYLNGVKQAQPSGAEYTLQVAAEGETPVQVKVELAGYDTLQKTVKLTAGATEKVSYTLTKTAVPVPTAKLTVMTEPTGAVVYLDGVKQDKLAGFEYTVKVAPKGETPVEVKVELAGYEQMKQTVKLTAGAKEVVRLTLTKTIAAKVKLQIGSTPMGAEVWIDGKMVGRTDGEFEVANKPFQLKVQLMGYVTQTSEVDPAKVVGGKVIVKLVALPPTTRKITIASVPKGAQIFINDEIKPRGETDLVVEVPNKPFKVRLVKPGYEVASQQVDPANLPADKVEITLTPKKAVKAMMVWNAEAVVATAKAVVGSPNGAWVAAADQGGTVALLNAADGKQQWRKDKEINHGDFLVFAADSQTLIVGSRDGGVIAFTAEGQLLWKQDGSNIKGISAMALAPGGKLVLWVSPKGFVGKLEVRTGKIESTHPLAVTKIGGAAIATDGKSAVVADADNNDLSRIELENFKVVGKFSGHKKPVVSIAVSQEPGFVSADADGLHGWTTGSAKETWFRKAAGASGLAMAPDGKRVLAAEDKRLAMYNVGTGEEVWTGAHKVALAAAGFMSNGAFGIAGGADRRVYYWRLPE
jgi:serine/threonine-protein kinase